MSAQATPRGVWLTLFILCGLYAASFIDRMVLALVIDPIRASMQVTDTQMSLLFGLGFVTVYVLAGLPLAHLVDKGSRKRILIFGVLLWSVSTFLSGLATNFWALVLLRAGVAIGEAVLMPIAMSMIFDLFPKDRRTFPTTFFMMTGVAMAPGAFIVGAGALALAEHIVPITGGSPWRIMFMLVALPGLLLILLFTRFGHDPERRVEDEEAPAEARGTRMFIAHLRASKSIYLPVFLGTGCVFMIGMGLSAWTSTMLVREHGVPATSAGVYYGIFSVIGGLVGTNAVGLLVRRLGRDGGEKGIIRTALLTTITTIPPLALTIGSSDLNLVLVGTFIGTFGIMGATTFVPLLMQQITPRALLGRTSAVYLLCNNIMGMGLGPFVVTTVAQRYADQPGSIGTAMTIVCWSGLIVALTCFAYALFTLARRDPPARAEVAFAT